MNIYYIDYENVSSQGLKGVELLTEKDEVVLLYSKKADNVKIDILTMMMESKAKIRFLPVHVGTPNALDFQLVTLLFLNYKPEDYCYIISKDSGYDCCIKTAAQNGADHVARYPNIESAVNKTTTKKTRRQKNTAGTQDTVVIKPSSPESVPVSEPTPSADGTVSEENDIESSAAVPEETSKKKPSRRRGRKKASPSEAEDAQTASSSADNTPAREPVTETTVEKELPKAPGKVQEKGQRHSQEKEKEKASDKPQEVLQQRYLSRQFDSKPQSSNGGGARTDADKPVSILSVIRRRNDVQLDMHQIDLIREALKNSNNKQQFYSYFVKKLGQKQGIELYHCVKSSYTDLVNANLL